MKRSLLHFLLTVIFVCLCTSGSYPATVDVSMVNYSFQPETVTINAGDTVRWINQGGSHTTTSGTGCVSDGKWNSGLLSTSQTYSVMFNTAGTYPYFCMPHCSLGMTGTVVVNPSTSIMAIPTSQQIFNYPPTESPGLNTDASQAKPIGVGTIATGGNTLSLRIGLYQFAGAVDIYFAISAPKIDPNNIYILNENYNLQKYSDVGLIPWKRNITGSVDEALFGDIPTSLLPAATYYLYIVVTPTNSLSSYYFWTTYFTIQ